MSDVYCLHGGLLPPHIQLLYQLILFGLRYQMYQNKQWKVFCERDVSEGSALFWERVVG